VILPRCSALLSSCLLAAAAGGLLAAPAAAWAAPNDAKNAKAEAEAAAMERARRLAANPMRVILEASRVRRRANGEPLPAAAPAAGVVPVAAAAAAAPLARPEVTPRAMPATQPREVATPGPAIIAAPDLAQTRSAPTSEPAFDPESVAQPLTLAVPAQAPLTAPTPEPARPTLITRVDPDPPARLLTEFGASTVITADLTIKPDGSVSQVVIVTPNMRSLGRYVVTALRQWRFAPLPSERVWRVEVVFRTE
jgi:hypothetical protein